ncbi:hypothetical protein ACPOL_2671 [Acidisarcina polymorpha]|uniref:Uncharacterized protein n=1 Tax=Acidisarcina polymorpha TaxID=2211140 RepID=A0A2Z5FZM7_9BACT|nr:hypothetical protein ACPOL_2671 [Acidisarcina polymorpha]
MSDVGVENLLFSMTIRRVLCDAQSMNGFWMKPSIARRFDLKEKEYGLGLV